MDQAFRKGSLPNIPNVPKDIRGNIRELSKGINELIKSGNLAPEIESMLNKEFQESIEQMTGIVVKAKLSKKIIAALKKYKVSSETISTILIALEDTSLMTYVFVLHFLKTFQSNPHDFIAFVETYIDRTYEEEVNSLLYSSESVVVTSPFLNFLFSQLPLDEYYFDAEDKTLYYLANLVEEVTFMLIQVRDILVNPLES